MRELFRAYYPLSETETEAAWREGLVVIDTNALLNLYRYPIAARDAFLKVLEGVSDRLWIPHHVALEYQRNRAAVRLEQETQFQRVRDEVGKLKTDFESRIERLQLRKRHALIDQDALLNPVRAAIDAFQGKLTDIEHEQSSLYQGEMLQQRIDDLFAGKLGPMPTCNWLEGVLKEGKRRYEGRVPPGYRDADKGSSGKESVVLYFGGLYFERRYGDWIIWKQILEKAKADSHHSIVFVTDDGKEDWWQLMNGRRVGPRPELLDEAAREGGVVSCIFQTSEDFTEGASHYLGISVNADVIKQISTTVGAPMVISPDADTLLRSDEEPGFLEKLADTEDGLSQLREIAEGLKLELEHVTAIATEGAAQASAASDTRMKAKITNTTASRFAEVADSFDRRVDALDVCLEAIRPGLVFVIREGHKATNDQSQVTEARSALVGLLRTILRTADETGKLDHALSEVPEATAALRIAVRKLRAAVQRFVKSARHVGSWLPELPQLP